MRPPRRFHSPELTRLLVAGDPSVAVVSCGRVLANLGPDHLLVGELAAGAAAMVETR